jgi:hypothetical protein
VEAIGVNGIKIIPEILIQGSEGANGPISGLLGMEMLKQIKINEGKEQSQPTPINPDGNIVS